MFLWPYHFASLLRLCDHGYWWVNAGLIHLLEAYGVLSSSSGDFTFFCKYPWFKWIQNGFQIFDEILFSLTIFTFAVVCGVGDKIAANFLIIYCWQLVISTSHQHHQWTCWHKQVNLGWNVNIFLASSNAASESLLDARWRQLIALAVGAGLSRQGGK
jgi:hypothetical protein